MEQLRSLYDEASRFRSERKALAAAMQAVEPEYEGKKKKAAQQYAADLKTAEDSLNSAKALEESRKVQKAEDYTRMEEHLTAYLGQVRHLCPRQEIRTYLPNPAKVNEAQVNELIRKIQEQGFLAWLKRLLHIGGYGSRTEMAVSVYRQISDACAYCRDQIQSIEQQSAQLIARKTTETNREKDALRQSHAQQLQKLDGEYAAKKQETIQKIRDFDTSVRLQAMRDKITAMYIPCDRLYSNWGDYQIPTAMPDQVLLCDLSMRLPDANGIGRNMPVPLWLDLYRTNIVVITTSTTGTTGTKDISKILARRFLARMLKTIPPECCSYSVFDSLRKGSSLERLIDVADMGTTDLRFELFTSEEHSADTVSCGERRQYLRSHPAEIIKYLAGSHDSLFSCNQAAGDFEHPFHWIVDLNFPDDPGKKMLDDMRDLFVNAHAAGYSFLFVTTPAGLQQLQTLADEYSSVKIIHIDCDKKTCSQGDFSVELANRNTPNADQIGNFVTAMKDFYKSGSNVNNRMNAVFASRGFSRLDATQKLSVPMALDSRGRLVSLELGGDGSVHGFVSGGTNSGKSTLLHSIILSACLHYTPEDLEIWLVDYKLTDFHLYKTNTPPHVKLIGVSKTPDFTFSLLDKINEEVARRTELMNRFNALNLTSYRRHAGEPGYVNIPRLLLVIDEFHNMSQFVAGNEEYKNALENILREYRAQGLTCLLADQAFSTGLGGLSPAAKKQIGLRIAMRNEGSPQEVKDTLEVDRALYSDSMNKTISIMRQGDFIMKVYVRDKNGNITDVHLEKFKALHATEEDIAGLGSVLQQVYPRHTGKPLYVDTRHQVGWNMEDMAALDQQSPLRYPNMRLYLGRAATLRPCFQLDLGRQPNENLSIVGGEAFQRYELIHSILQSCQLRNYRVLVFAEETSHIMTDYGRQIQALCDANPQAELLVTMGQWCSKLKELEKAVDSAQTQEDTLCLFIGLETAAITLSRLGDGKAGPTVGGTFLNMARYGIPVSGTEAPPAPPAPPEEFNALPIIDKLFSGGARYNLRCVVEASVYREFSKLLKLKEMCRHKVAFTMSADDCLMYLGNSHFQQQIGAHALYNDGSKTAQKLMPYKVEK